MDRTQDKVIDVFENGNLTTTTTIDDKGIRHEHISARVLNEKESVEAIIKLLQDLTDI